MTDLELLIDGINRGVVSIDELTDEQKEAVLAYTGDEDEGDDLPYSDKEHPAIDGWDRFIERNTSANPEEAIKFYRRQYPELDFKYDKKGNLRIKGEGEEEWRILDAPGFSNPSEFVHDVTDIAYDVPAGLLIGGAAEVGAAGGLPGSMALSGLVGGGLETAREGLGKALGVNEQIDPYQVGWSMATDAAGTGVFGDGVNKGLQQLLWRGAKPLGNVGLRDLAVKFGNTLSGVGENTLDYLSRKGKEFKLLQQQDYPATTLMEETAEKLEKAALNRKNLEHINYQIQLAKDKSGPGVYIGDIRDGFKRAIQERYNQATVAGHLTDADKAYIKELEDAMDEYFTVDVDVVTGYRDVPTGVLDMNGMPVMKQEPVWGTVKKPLPDHVTAEQAYKVTKDLSELAHHRRYQAGQITGNTPTAGQSPATTKIEIIANEARPKIIKQMDNAVSSGPAYRENYAKAADIANNVRKKMKHAQTGFSFFKNSDTGSRTPDYEWLHMTDDFLGPNAGVSAADGAAAARALETYGSKTRKAPRPSWFDRGGLNQGGVIGAAGAAGFFNVDEDATAWDRINNAGWNMLAARTVAGPGVMKNVYIPMADAYQRIPTFVNTGLGGKVLEKTNVLKSLFEQEEE